MVVCVIFAGLFLLLLLGSHEEDIPYGSPVVIERGVYRGLRGKTRKKRDSKYAVDIETRDGVKSDWLYRTEFRVEE